MIIKKFHGNSEEEAKEKAKAELGENAIIMSVRAVKSKGLKGVFKGVSFEVTAAIEDPKPQKIQTASKPEKVNLAADEEISIPQSKRDLSAKEQAQKIADTMKKIQPIIDDQRKQKIEDERLQEMFDRAKQATPASSGSERIKHFNAQQKGIDNRLNQIQGMLDETMTQSSVQAEEEKVRNKERLDILKMIYKVLLDNEVDEKYANQILEETDSVVRKSSSMDAMLSSVYQKVILKFGNNDGINLEGSKPKVLIFIGPTGVGKTTTIAKVASKYKVEERRDIAFLTADTYRTADQLQTYANILSAPLNIIYTPKELTDAIKDNQQSDVILVDTAGFSHKNEEQKSAVKSLIDEIDDSYDKQVFLCLSATTKYDDLIDIIDAYKQISDFKIVFTKLDETNKYGNLLNIRLYSGAPISFVTNGQNVPDDIEKFDSQKIVKNLLGGKEPWTRQKA